MTSISDKLKNRAAQLNNALNTGFDVPKVSFEFFPAKSENAGAKLLETIRRLSELSPEYISVTYGADGSTQETTFDLVAQIQRSGLTQPVPHLTCVDATREKIDEIAANYWNLGIRKILALRGDPKEGAGSDYTPLDGGYAYAADLVEGLLKSHDFEICVAAYPEVHPQAPSAAFDLDNLKRKFDAGASSAITQFFFDTDNFLRFRDQAVKAGIDKEIIPGVLPVLNYTSLTRFANACGAHLPAWLGESFNGLEEDPQIAKLIAVNIALDQVRRMQAEGVTHFHFYTLNQLELCYAVCRALGVTAVNQAGTST